MRTKAQYENELNKHLLEVKIEHAKNRLNEVKERLEEDLNLLNNLNEKLVEEYNELNNFISREEIRIYL